MWIENDIFREDLEFITSRQFIDWKKFENKTVFVTGGTGLIGFYVVNSLLYYNRTHLNKINILALVRNMKKACYMYKAQLQNDKKYLKFIKGSVEDLPPISQSIDFIIHGASPTASDFFVDKPVETIQISVLGTWNMLNLAKEKKIKSMIFLSTMEVYGPIQQREKVSETFPSYLNPMNPRSSYPESKRLCESLCSSFYFEYGVPVNCIRLTQTFGPGIAYNDQRLFAFLIRSAIEKKDIVLMTEGKTCRDYLYLADATTAILTILSSNEKNETFNAANENTYCSIKEMSELVADKISNKQIRVLVNLDGQKKTRKFMPELYMDLDTNKLKKLNWNAQFTLLEMFNRTIQSLQTNKG